MQIHGRMIVENLSRTGLGFRPLAPPSVRVNAVVQVTFTLDNPQQTLIQKAAQVRSIEGGFIGAAFSIMTHSPRRIASWGCIYGRHD